MNPRGMLVMLPFFLFAGLLAVVPQLEASRDARAAVIVVGLLTSIACSGLILVWVRSRSG